MALIFCSECGKQYSDKAMACPNCGNPTHTIPTPIQPQSQPQYATAAEFQMSNSAISSYAEKLATKEQTSGIIWTVIAVLQVIIGIAGVWFALIVAVINGFAAYNSFQKAKMVRNPYPGMVVEYEKQLTSLIIALVYNAIFGGVIGVAGNIFDLITRNYVLTNRAVFESIVEENAKKAETEANATGKVCLTIQYASSSGAAAAIQYTIDGKPEKHIVNKAASVNHYLAPGAHMIAIKYNFKECSFPFELDGNKTLSFYGSIKEVKLNNPN